ncbi:MAG TPA: hypothetical protein VFM88_10185 [Vicinamibacteria bacterium]|nr:hypothetical protein [Vicinamibacteria bacterium]
MELRRLVLGLVGLDLLLVATLSTHVARAASERDTLRGRAVELVDEQGRVRAQLDVETSGEVVLRLRDAKGEIRVKLGAGAEGSGLLLLDGSTEPGIHLLAKGGETSVTLASRGGQRRVITP